MISPIAESLKEVLFTYRDVGSSTLAEAPGFASLVTGVPFAAANMIALWADTARAEEMLDGALAPLLARPLPFLVWVLPPTDPTGVGARMLRAGLVPGGFLPAMTADLSRVPTEPETFEGLTLSTVETSDDMREWLEAFRQVYVWPTDALGLYLALFEADRARGKCWEFYLAKAGGKPIGCTSNFFGSKLAGLYSQGVVPEARRQGIGTALVRYALSRAKERGYTTSVLFATPEGTELYRKCGYEERFKAPVFIRPESQEDAD